MKKNTGIPRPNLLADALEIIDDLMKALEPFASCCTDEELDGTPSDLWLGYALSKDTRPTVGNIRAARAALSRARGEKP